MNAREAANVERWAAEDAAAKGQEHTPAWDAAWREHCANMAAEDAAAKEGPCALCRRPRRQWEDLCDDCADVFQDLADAIVDAQAPAAPPAQVAGQLELEDGEVSVATLTIVLDALRSGDFSKATTAELEDVLRYEAEGLKLLEVDLLKGELFRRGPA